MACSSTNTNPHAVCPFSGLTEQEKRDAEHLWAKIIGTSSHHLRNAGINLLYWMFDTIPDIKEHFTKFSANLPRKELMADALFLAHTQTVIMKIDSLVRSLDDPQNLKSKMVGLARTHLNLVEDVPPKYFRILATQCHKHLSAETGLPHDHPEIKAFAKIYDLLASIVEDVYKKDNRTQHSEPPSRPLSGGCSRV